MSAAPPIAARRDRPRDGYIVAVGLGIALFASLVVHGSLIISSVVGGAARGSGEAGHEGAGDMTVDISVAGPAADHPAPAVAPVPPPPQAPPDVSRPPEPPRAHTAPPTPHADVTPPVPDAPPATPDVAPGPPDPTPPVPDIAQAGTGADTTSGGRTPGLPDDALRALILGMAGNAPSGVEAQRALLPAATTCTDPVAGIWKAFKYNPLQSDWARFTLRIHHRPDGTLEGTITSRIWTGGPSDRTPPTSCGPGDMDYTTRMPAHGRVDEHLRVTFNSSTWETLAAPCPDFGHSYAPDNFSGTIDPTRQEFQSVNNDGAYDVNSPYVFRRVGCVDE